jgi:starch-binding outer membrane protein, SusD/RagB family
MKKISLNRTIKGSWLKLACLLLAAVSALGNCNFMFQPEEVSVSKIESHEQLVDAVDGVYGRFKDAINSKHFMYINFAGDDVEGPSNASYNFYYQKSANVSSIQNHVYVNFYKTIASINNILVQYDENKVEKNDAEIIGELFFLRAYCYFRLTRTYGQIKIIDNDKVSFMVENASFAEIYEFIEADLINAIAMLPENQSRIAYETPHMGMAKAVLAEVYLSWAGYPVNDRSKYELARVAAFEVIENAGLYGFGLVDDFEVLWNNSGTNPEIVFCCFYSNEILLNNGINERDNLYYGFVDTSTHRINNWFYPESGRQYGSLPFNVELDFYNNYPKDYRRDVTFFNYIYMPGGWDVNELYIEPRYIYIDKIDHTTRLTYRKFYLNYKDIEFNLPNHPTFFVGTNKIYIYRYAHTLLTYAESAARSGKLDAKAYDCINMVRRRANRVDMHQPSPYDLKIGLTNEAFADSVVQERAWEFAGEPEGRWFDLLRLDIIDIVLMQSSDSEYNHNQISKMKDYFLLKPE